MDVVFSQRAQSDLVVIGEYVGAQDQGAAVHLVYVIVDTLLMQLSSHPNSGRPGRVDGTRELVVHASYIAVYRVRNNVVEVLTVRHTARLWPTSL